MRLERDFLDVKYFSSIFKYELCCPKNKIALFAILSTILDPIRVSIIRFSLPVNSPSSCELMCALLGVTSVADTAAVT